MERQLAAVQRVLEIQPVPNADAIELDGDSFQHTQETLLVLAEGTYPGTRNEREGIVIRPRREMLSAALNGRLSFKVISNRFLFVGVWKLCRSILGENKLRVICEMALTGVPPSSSVSKLTKSLLFLQKYV